MKKSIWVFIAIAISLSLTWALATSTKPVLTDIKSPVVLKPVVEEVPEPAVLPEDIPSTKVSKGVKHANDETKMGLIKEEKNFVDKNCRKIKGKMICSPKEVKNKKIDPAPDRKGITPF